MILDENVILTSLHRAIKHNDECLELLVDLQQLILKIKEKEGIK